jgi:RimJ/RimL family protein N-acetyltransferase
MHLHLSTCTVRPWRDGDQPSLVRHANNRNVWLNLRDLFPHPYTPADADAWIARNLAADPITNWAIVVGEEACGGIGITLGQDVHRRTAEIGYWLGEAHWGKGVVTEALVAVTDHCFATFDIDRLHADVYDHNAASARVLEKAGYTFEGRFRRSIVKDGRVHDQLVYARVR